MLMAATNLPKGETMKRFGFFVVGFCVILVVAASAGAEFCQITWTNDAAPIPDARYRAGAVVHDGKLYVWGGSQSNFGTGRAGDYTYYADLRIYNPVADSWSSGAAMPQAKANFGFAAVDGYAYAVAGYYSDDNNTPFYVDTVFRYELEGNQWETVADYPHTYSGLMCGDGGDGQLYCFGGWDGVDDKADAYVYDPDENAWTEIDPMPNWKDFGYAVSDEGIIYALGGWKETGGDPAVYAYRVGDQAWSTLAQATGRQSPVAAVVGGLIWLAGGCDADDEPLEVYDQFYNGSQWLSTGEAMLHPRAGAAAGYLPDYGIFVVGGWDPTRVGTADNQLWQLCLPTFEQLTPATGPVGTAVTIEGEQFERNTFVFLTDDTKARYLLGAIEVVDDSTIQAVIPDVTAGAYGLLLRGTLGQEYETDNAFVVTDDDDDDDDDDNNDNDDNNDDNDDNDNNDDNDSAGDDDNDSVNPDVTGDDDDNDGCGC
jgi:N-acetylneuraminic acid mutarotase